MNEEFARVVEALHPSLDRLLAMQPARNGELPTSIPKRGVYLFSEGKKHLYVGRSNSLRKRYKQHCLPSSQHNQAVFAFKLARMATGRTTPAYVSGESTRKGLSLVPDFAKAFSDAKGRVRAMNFRFVAEDDQTRQALLELYCAISLGCPYNDFNTH